VPSEHTVKGKSYPLEIHFVHLADKEGCEKLQNKISVLGIFVEIDE
jgi:carbonic anhydrase